MGGGLMAQYTNQFKLMLAKEYIQDAKFLLMDQSFAPNHNSYLQLQRRKKHVDSYGKAKTIRPRNECTSREEAYREPMESGVFFRSDVLDEVSINPDGT